MDKDALALIEELVSRLLSCGWGATWLPVQREEVLQKAEEKVSIADQLCHLLTSKLTEVGELRLCLCACL
jgi:hypothetical protein